MNISIVTNYDLPATYALNLLLNSPVFKKHQINVFYTRKKSSKALASSLAELSEFEAAILNEWQHNSEKLNRFTTLENLSARHQINVAKMNRINTEDLATLKSAKPDLIISIRHMSILKDQVIKLPTHGVINLHSGVLPAYQGVMATFWAMLNNEPQLGTTLHWIDSAAIDSGETIAIHQTPIQSEQSYLRNVLDLYQPGCELILQAVQNIAKKGTTTSKPQQGEANYYSFPQETDFAKFKNTGKLLFDTKDQTILLKL